MWNTAKSIVVKAWAGAEGPFNISENEWRRERSRVISLRVRNTLFCESRTCERTADCGYSPRPYAQMTQSTLKFIGGDLTTQVGART